MYYSQGINKTQNFRTPPNTTDKHQDSKASMYWSGGKEKFFMQFVRGDIY